MYKYMTTTTLRTYTSNREMGVTTLHIVGRKKTVSAEKKTKTDYIFYYSIVFAITIQKKRKGSKRVHRAHLTDERATRHHRAEKSLLPTTASEVLSSWDHSCLLKKRICMEQGRVSRFILFLLCIMFVIISRFVGERRKKEESFFFKSEFLLLALNLSSLTNIS